MRIEISQAETVKEPDYPASENDLISGRLSVLGQRRFILLRCLLCPNRIILSPALRFFLKCAIILTVQSTGREENSPRSLIRVNNNVFHLNYS